MKIHHLGIVTNDVAGTLVALGLSRDDIAEIVFDPVQKNNLHFINLPENNLWLELVEPMSESASTAKFAKKHGVGLHHIGMASDDLGADETTYGNVPYAFTLGRYHIDVRSFGGKISTLFIAFKGLILEFVKVD